MSIIQQSQINGIIDTGKNVIENMNMLATAGHSFFTFDIQAGLWTFIQNSTGTSVKSFDDSNIIGPIQLHSKGLNEFYNAVSIEIPHKSLRNATDIVTVRLPEADWYPNESYNEKKISLPLINDPVQAQYIASIELKTNRLEKVLRFSTDFSANGLQAGELIDITSSMHQFSSKLFRIIEVEESDTDEGSVLYNIFAIEYDASVYSTSGLERDLRTQSEAIIGRCANEKIDENELEAFGNDVDETIGGEDGGFIRDFLVRCPTITGPSEVCEDTDIVLTITAPSDVCSSEDITVPYEITGVESNDINIPLSGTFTLENGTTNFTIPVIANGDSAETLVFRAGRATHETIIYPLYDKTITNVVADNSTITEGDSVTITVTTDGYGDGESIPYTVTGDTNKINESLTGNVTVNSNEASVTFTTTDDQQFGESEQFTVEFDTGFDPSPCAIVAPTITITMENNSAPGSGPEPFRCDYVEVPIVWCGVYDADTEYLIDVEVRKTALLPRVSTGGQAVPLTVSVTDPNTASAAISIDTTEQIDTTTGAGGAKIDVITSFATPPSGGATLITGTTVTINGYW